MISWQQVVKQAQEYHNNFNERSQGNCYENDPHLLADAGDDLAELVLSYFQQEVEDLMEDLKAPKE